MEPEEVLSPQRSLDLIAAVIRKTKENIHENSFGFLLWGWLIAIASFALFVLHRYTGTKYYFIPFPVLAAIGVIATAISLKRKNTQSTLTYTSFFINKMWIVLAICFLIVVYINVSQGKMPFTYTLVIAGIGTLVSGWVMNFVPLIIGGILLLSSAVGSLYVGDDYKPLLHGIAFVAGYLVPGYLLKMAKV
jgi:hypothetical protein